MTPEELEEALKNDPQYQLLQAQMATIRAELAALGVDVENLDAWLESAGAALKDLQGRVEELENILEGQGIDPGALTDKIKELESSLPQIDEGIAAIEEGIRQIDDGMLQLKDAQLLLSSKKTEGLLQMTSAATELAVNGATVTAAMTQIEGGYDQASDHGDGQRHPHRPEFLYACRHGGAGRSQLHGVRGRGDHRRKDLAGAFAL